MKKLLITAFALLAFAAGSQAQTNNKINSFHNRYELFRFKMQIYDKLEIYNEKPAGIYTCYFLFLRYS